MKIRHQLQITIVGIALTFGLFGLIEQRNIDQLAEAFQSLDSHKGPSITALLEILAATRFASIGAVEYSLFGDPEDRAMTLEAMQRIELEFSHYRDLGENRSSTELEQLSISKVRFSKAIENYLTISQGTSLQKMLSEEKKLQLARDKLILVIDEQMEVAPRSIQNELLKVKSSAREVSIRLVEYVLRGNSTDHAMALEAISQLRTVHDTIASHELATQLSPDPVSEGILAYLAEAEAYQGLTTAKQYPVESIHAKEMELQDARESLTQALNPLIEQYYEKLNQDARSTMERIQTASHLQIYSILLITFIALVAAGLLARSISTPLSKLTNLVHRFGQGESIASNEQPTGGAQELRELGQAMLNMMCDRQILESSLKSSESFVRMLLDTSPVGLTLTQENGSFIEANPAFGRITGRSVEEILKLTTWQITPPEYHEIEKAQNDSLIHNRQYGPFEKEYLHKDGHRVPVRLSGLLIERDGGQQIWSVVEDITQQKQAASEIERQLHRLSETKRRLAEAQHVAHIGNWELDLQSKVLWWSDEVFNIFEIERDQFPGTYRAFLDRTHPDDRGEVNRIFAESIENRTPYDVIHRVLMPDGRTKYVHERGESHFDEAGVAIRSIGTVQDISDYHMAQESLRKNEQWLSLILDTLPHGVQENDTNGVITYSNRAHHRILGWQPGELIGHYIWEPQTDPQQEQNLRDYLAYLIKEQPDPEPYVTRNLTRDGREIIVEITWNYLRDDRQAVSGFISVISDITERKQAELDLAVSEERFRNLVESSRDWIWEVDAQGAYTYVSPRCQVLLGYAPEEILGLTPFELMSTEESSRVKQIFLDRVNRHEPIIDLENTNLHKDGRPVVLETSGVPFFDEQGKLAGYRGVDRDITERKRINDALQSSEAYVRMLFDNSPIGLVLCRMDGSFVEVNPTFAAIIGYSITDALKLSNWDITPDKYQREEQARLESLRHEGRYGPYEKEYIHIDGHHVPVRLLARLIVKDGQSYIWSAVEDISAIRESEMLSNRLSKIFEHSFDEIYLFDADTLRFIQVSAGALRNLGYDIQEMLEMTPVDLKPDFTQKSFTELIEPLRHDQRQLVFETRHQRKDGSLYPVEVRLQFSAEEIRPIYFAFILDMTERQRVLEALRKIEERYSLAAKIGHSGAWEIWPVEGKIFFDENLTHLLGYEVDELSEDLADWVGTVPEYARGSVASAIQAVIDGHSDRYVIEHPVNRKDGTIGWVFVQGQRVSRPGEQRIRLIGSSVDITERKQAEERLQESEASLKEAQALSHLGNWSLDLSSNVLSWSEEQFRLLGYEPGAVTPNIETFMSAVHPDDQARVTADIEQLMQDTASESFTRHRIVLPDQSERVVEERGRIQLDAEGKPSRVFGTTMDITQRIQMEHELESYRIHLEKLVEERTSTIRQQARIIDQTHDSVVTTDLDGIITSWNKGAYRLFGFSPIQAIGRHISCVYPLSQYEYLQNEVIAPLKAHGQYETEVTLQRSDGSEFPAHLSLSLLTDEQGQPQGMVGYSLDISEQKHREQELASLAQNLQTANKELESFSYSVSHDLRAPLRAIDGFSLALMEDYADQLDETAVDYLHRVRNGAQRMGMLIDDLLQLSRVSRESLKMEEVDLSEIAGSIMREFQANEPSRAIEYTQDEGIRVMGDARLLRVMLENLLGNAWKFTSQESNSYISFKRRPDNPQILSVKDNGVGFDMRYADKLFGAFQRLHRATDFPGTGVGLATVQRIVHRHGGKIWAESQVDKGATFSFTLSPDLDQRK